jgi:spermidine synthase
MGANKKISLASTSTLILILSFCSFSYQILIARLFIADLGNELLAYGATTGLYFFGLATGTALQKKLAIPLNFRTLQVIEIALPTYTILSAFMFFAVSTTTFNSFISESFSTFSYLYFKLFFAVSIPIVIGALTSFELPILELQIENKTSFSRSLGFSYLGALLSGLTFSQTFRFDFTTLELLVLISSFNVLSALVFIKEFKIVCVLSLLMILMLGKVTPKIEYQLLKLSYVEFNSAFEYSIFKKIQILISESKKMSFKRINSEYQTIDFITEPNRTALYINRNYQFDSRYEHDYHQSFINIILSSENPDPKRILLLGAGDGLLARTLLSTFKDIEIDLVEIDPSIIFLAKNESALRTLNQSSLWSSKIKIHIDDAFQFSRRSTNKWDWILADFPYPTSIETSKLYSVEFYRSLIPLLSSRSGGLIFDFPLRESSDIIKATLMAAGYKTILGYEYGETFVYASHSNQTMTKSTTIRIFPLAKSSEQNANSIYHPTLPRFF